MANLPVSCRFSASEPQQNGDIHKSTGRFVSNTDVADVGTIFTSLSPEENSAMENIDKCLFLCNTGNTDILFISVVIDQVQPGIDLSLGVDILPASRMDSSSPQSSLDASTVTFSQSGNWTPFGPLPVGHCRAIWIRLHGLDSPPSNSTFRLGIRSSQSSSIR